MLKNMISVRHMALVVAIMGLKAFALGIAAERKKPESGTAVIAGGIATCKYPSDPSVYFGFTSILSLTVGVAIGIYAVFFPYQGKVVPLRSLFRTTTMIVFFQIALFVSMFAEVLLLWPTISELKNLINNTPNRKSNCATAPSGVFGGGAFMALNACLFWIVCLMLTENAREDHFDDQEEESGKGAENGRALGTAYEPQYEKTTAMAM